MGAPFTSEQPRRLCRNIHSVHFGMATPFGRNLHVDIIRLSLTEKVFYMYQETLEYLIVSKADDFEQTLRSAPALEDCT